LEIIELLADTGQIADSIVIGISETAGIDLIKDSLLPPGRGRG
jgi:hypothetical protein